MTEVPIENTFALRPVAIQQSTDTTDKGLLSVVTGLFNIFYAVSNAAHQQCAEINNIRNDLKINLFRLNTVINISYST